MKERASGYIIFLSDFIQFPKMSCLRIIFFVFRQLLFKFKLAEMPHADNFLHTKNTINEIPET